jgi:hypothetical protein
VFYCAVLFLCLTINGMDGKGSPVKAGGASAPIKPRSKKATGPDLTPAALTKDSKATGPNSSSAAIPKSSKKLTKRVRFLLRQAVQSSFWPQRVLFL